MKSDAKTPAEYIAALPPERKAAIQTLDRAIRKAAPRLKPQIKYGMLCYGGDAETVALASQKNYISLYLCGAETRKKELGKVSVGKSCIRFRNLEDLNVGAAMALVKEAAQ